MPPGQRPGATSRTPGEPPAPRPRRPTRAHSATTLINASTNDTILPAAWRAR